MTSAPTTEEPRGPRKRGTTALIITGVLLLIVGLGVGLWALYAGEEGPDRAADCRMIESEAPEFGEDLMKAQQMGQNSEARQEWLAQQAAHLREVADKLTDREFARDVYAGADAMDAARKDLQRGDIASLVTGLRSLTKLYKSLATFLDTYCPRWIGPGQWGTPGTKPTAPKDLPTSLPTDLPSVPSVPPVPRPAPTPPRPTPTEEHRAVPRPSPTNPRVGQSFTAVVARNDKTWTLARVTLRAVEVHPPGSFRLFDKLTVVLLRYEATNIGDRTVRFGADPIGGSFLVSGRYGVPAAPVRFAPWSQIAPRGCTQAVEPLDWRPGKTLRGCQVATLAASSKPREVTFISGLPDQTDTVWIDYP